MQYCAFPTPLWYLYLGAPLDHFSTVILVIPCVWLGFAVQNTATPFGVFIIIALMCGFAGANFASSMGNISFFFPKAKQGSALGINGGLGNLGVSVMQLIAPLVIFLPIFTFWACRAYHKLTDRYCHWPMPHGFGCRYC